jgi:hypothetical protein
MVILLIYVDDILIIGPNAAANQHTLTILQSHFKLKILGDLHYFLGLELAHSSKGINLCQQKYTIELLEDTGFSNCKAQSLPMDPGIKLSKDEGAPLSNPSQYRRLIGRLLYLCISRPDIAFTVNKLSQYMAAPQQPHLQAVHHLLQYLRGSPSRGILFSASSPLHLTASDSDADWGSCTDTRRSTSGLWCF